MELKEISNVVSHLSGHIQNLIPNIENCRNKSLKAVAKSKSPAHHVLHGGQLEGVHGEGGLKLGKKSIWA